MFILFYVSILSTIMDVYHKHEWCPRKLEEGIAPPESGTTDGYKPLYGLLKSNVIPLQEQHI